MGGHAAGEIASEIAASTAESLLATAIDAGADIETLKETVRTSFQVAHDAIADRSRSSPHTRGMGTTLTLCVIQPDGMGLIGHIGDSRLYRLRGGTLEQITHDHTWVQREVDAGRLTVDDARTHPLAHIVTRVLTEDIEPTLDLTTTSLLPDDLLMLATDGLYNMIADSEIEAILAAGAPLPGLTNDLIAAANAEGGVDNITVLLIRILPCE